MTFGEKFKNARKQAGLTQEELANRLGVSRSAVAKWETDKGLPDISNIKAIAQLLNVSIDYLLEDGTTLDLSVTREAVDLGGATGFFKKAKKKECLIREKFPAAVIWGLTAKQKLTKSEKIRDEALEWFTAFLPGTGVIGGGSDIVHAFENLNTAFYLVDDGNTQYFVSVTDEYMDIHQMAEAIAKKKFEIGNFVFMKSRKPLRA